VATHHTHKHHGSQHENDASGRQQACQCLSSSLHFTFYSSHFRAIFPLRCLSVVSLSMASNLPLDAEEWELLSLTSVHYPVGDLLGNLSPRLYEALSLAQASYWPSSAWPLTR